MGTAEVQLKALQSLLIAGFTAPKLGGLERWWPLDPTVRLFYAGPQLSQSLKELETLLSWTIRDRKLNDSRGKAKITSISVDIGKYCSLLLIPQSQTDPFVVKASY